MKVPDWEAETTASGAEAHVTTAPGAAVSPKPISQPAATVPAAEDDEIGAIARHRLKGLYRFIRELHLARNPVVTDVRAHPWLFRWRELPVHESIRTDESEDEESLLRVRRAVKSAPPSPPEPLRPWLLPGWDDPAKEPAFREKEVTEDSGADAPVTVRFRDDEARARAWEVWTARWKAWAELERPARASLELFGRLYDLHGRIDREGEQYELLIGEGIIRSSSGGPLVEHPVLTIRVDLSFDPSIPEFSIRESGRSPDLVGSVLRSVANAQTGGLEVLRQELEEGQFHPLGEADTSGFLKNVIHRVLPTEGEYLNDREEARRKAGPVLYRDPVLFLRKKVPGIAEMADRIVEDLDTRDEIPRGLERIVGVARTRTPEAWAGASGPGSSAPVDVLLSKPANTEQVKIVEQLTRSGCVLVQGPPGTGKSHTIGNLIGHLLAHGKSVLVTAHTIKSLRVLRGLVEREIQSLCMSVLDADLASRSALEESVAEIVRRLGEDADGSSNGAEAERLDRKRQQLKKNLESAEKALAEAGADEHRQIVVGGREISPADAARKVRAGTGTWEWLPAGLEPGAALPLSTTEVEELYQSNLHLSAIDEDELDSTLPPLEKLVAPGEVEQHIRNLHELQATDRAFGRAYWASVPDDPTDLLGGIAARLQEATAHVMAMPAWQRAIAAIGADGARAREVWLSLLRQIDEFVAAAETSAELRYAHGPKLAPDMSTREQAVTAAEVAFHLENGGTLGLLSTIPHPPWRRLRKSAGVRSGNPSEAVHFRAIEAEARHALLAEELGARWDSQVASLGAPASGTMGASPHRAFREFGVHLRKALGWRDATWGPLEDELTRIGFRVADAIGSLPPVVGNDGNIQRLAQAVRDVVLPSVQALRTDLALNRAVRVLGSLCEELGPWAESSLGRRLLNALVERDLSAYASAYSRREELERKSALLVRRRGLLARIEAVAPAWAAAVRMRRAPHDEGASPGSAAAAWRLRQWNEELDRRSTKDLVRLQNDVHRLRDDVLRVTAQLVERKAWASQIRKTDLPMKQALIGWEQTVKRIGKGTGKRAPKLRREAQRLMEQAVGSVPVWIMPLARVAEQFDPRVSRFDVVIVDEASQSDVLALTALYLGREIVVVGDDEQVSPEAVGQDLETVEHLIYEHLRDVPNRLNFDGKLSVYDLAKASFGGTLTLREHFRCVPEIIQFCNQLSYSGPKSLVPLRDASRVPRRPFVVPYRVEAGPSRGRVNEVEADVIAALVIAALAEPEYKLNESGKPVSFGVISLVGDEQAYRVDSILRQRISPQEYETRRILCGNPAQFQGDERDVVFLSMVDAPEGDGPLPLRNDDRFKKRFNVAVSRARDQLWVVYSLNPDTNLKGDDLRLRLIRHAQNPSAAVEALRQGESRVQSEFERLVLRDLVGRGYRVTTQFQVGRYSIDLVAECDGRRMAIECDGDRFHGLEQLEADMQRQALLERLGWRFIRIRGSSFFRDPDRAMAEVVARLGAAEIHPVATDPGDVDTGELLVRLTAGAEEIRRAWREPEEEAGEPEESPELVPTGPEVRTSVGILSTPPVPLREPEPGPTEPLELITEGPGDATGPSAGSAGWVSDYESVVFLLQARGTIANRDVQELLGIGREDATIHLRRLVRDGLAVKVGSKRGTRYEIPGRQPALVSPEALVQ